MAFAAAFIVFAGLSAAVFVWGLRLPRARPFIRKTALAAASALVLLRLLFKFAPAIELTLFPWTAFGYAKLWWAFVPFSLILGFGAATIPRNRRSVYIGLGGFLYVWFAWSHVLMLATNYAALPGKPDARGLCAQSTPYTCGPAAGVTALHALGIPATEADLAIELRPTPYTGTNEHLLARELDRRLAASCGGRRARLVLLPDDLRRIDVFPVVATRGLTALVDHWIVLGAREPGGIRVYDPISGISTVPHDRLAKMLNPVAIRLVTE
jgi:hypothetical protein